MAWDKGWNLRGTAAGPSGFDGDGTNETYLIGSNDTGGGGYPITRNGVTFGWTTDAAGTIAETAIEPSDRADIDRRLAGDNHRISAYTRYLRIDLPAAADYTLSCAVGTYTYSEAAPKSQVWEPRDSTTVLFTLDVS